MIWPAFYGRRMSNEGRVIQKENQTFPDFHCCSLDLLASPQHTTVDHFKAEHISVEVDRPIKVSHSNAYVIQ
jgi:hypothetical protein